MAAHVPQRPGVVRLSTPPTPLRWPSWLPVLGWVLLLAVLPWWLGLPVLLVCALALLWHALAPGWSTARLRQGLRWGLAGLLLAVLRAGGMDALGGLFALLAALVGFSLLMLLENWLDRDRVVPLTGASTAEWPELAQAAVGPTAAIIELRPPAWQAPDAVLAALPDSGLRWQSGELWLGDGSRLSGLAPHCDVGEDGRWLVLPLAGMRGVLLLDRRQGRRHRLRGWVLAGWQGSEPWLSRGEDRLPEPLVRVLGTVECRPLTADI